MSKQSKIKWRVSDKQRLSRAIQQFNAKLTRLSKSKPELAPFLPKRVKVSEIMNKIATRQDFNREVKSLERFLRKGMESPVLSKSGIMTTKWEKLEIGYKVREINRRRKIEREQANVSTYKGTMGTIKANNLLPKQYDINKIRARDWAKFIESVEKQVKSSYNYEKILLYHRNYKTAIKNNFRNATFRENLLAIVDAIDPEWLYNIYYEEPRLQIDFNYDEHEEIIKYTEMINAFNEHGINTDRILGAKNEIYG